MNWKGISLFFILLVASFGLSLMNYSPTEISPPNSYALETERVRISGTDFSMQILKGYNFSQRENSFAGLFHYSPYLPYFHISHGKIGGVQTTSFISADSFLARPHNTDHYINLKEYNLDGIQIFIAKNKEVPHYRDLVVFGWVLYENQTLSIHGWGPVEKTNEVYAMLETMLLTLRVETEE